MTAGNEVNQRKMPAAPPADEGTFGNSLQSVMDADESAGNPEANAQAGTAQTFPTKTGTYAGTATAKRTTAQTDASAAVNLLLSAPVTPEAQQATPWQLTPGVGTDAVSFPVTAELSSAQFDTAQMADATQAATLQPGAPPIQGTLTALAAQIQPDSDGLVEAGSRGGPPAQGSGDQEVAVPEADVTPAPSTAPQDAKGRAVAAADQPADAALGAARGFVLNGSALKAASGASLLPHAHQESSATADPGAKSTSTSAPHSPVKSAAVQATGSAAQAAPMSPELPADFNLQTTAAASSSPVLAAASNAPTLAAASAAADRRSSSVSGAALRQAGAAAGVVQTDDDSPAPTAAAGLPGAANIATVATFAVPVVLKDKAASEKTGGGTPQPEAVPAVSGAQQAASPVQEQALPQVKTSAHESAAPALTEAGETQLRGMSSQSLQKVLQHSEMQVHVDAAEFGQVSVHARYDQGGIAAHIRLEDSSMATALGSALSAGATHLEQRLQGGLGTSASVSVSTGAGSTSSGGSEAQGEARSRQQVPGAAGLRGALTTYPADALQSSSSTAPLTEFAGRRVDIHI